MGGRNDGGAVRAGADGVSAAKKGVRDALGIRWMGENVERGVVERPEERGPEIVYVKVVGDA